MAQNMDHELEATLHFYEEEEREFEKRRLAMEGELQRDEEALKAQKDAIDNYLLSSHQMGMEDGEFFMRVKGFQQDLVELSLKMGRDESELASIVGELGRVRENMAQVRGEIVHMQQVHMLGADIFDKTTVELKLKFRDLYYAYRSYMHNVDPSTREEYAPDMKDAVWEKMRHAKNAMDALALLLESRGIRYAVDSNENVRFYG
jgi:hypothetical protein